MPVEDPKSSEVPWGISDLRLTELCGPTPHFSWGGVKATYVCHVDASEWSAFWASAQELMAKLQKRHSPLERWLNQLRVRSVLVRGIQPFAVAWQALEAALDLFPYPIQPVSSIHRPQLASCELSLYSACPYPLFIANGMHLIAAWLTWSHRYLQLGRLPLSARSLYSWLAIFDRLSQFIPSPEVRALHYQCWKAGIDWQWLGSNQTRLGMGHRQCIVEGFPRDLDVTDLPQWQIPIYTVTGSVGKTTTARLLWQALHQTKPKLALAASDGAWVGDRKVAEGDCIGGRAAKALLAEPTVHAAVFEQGRGGLIKQGVPYRHSDVAILLNVQDVHIGRDGIYSLGEMADVKAMGLHPARLVVLNLEDDQCRRLGKFRDPSSCIWFGLTTSQEILQELSQTACGALGVERDRRGAPVAVMVWTKGRLADSISLEGVAPYQGSLGSKTLEELLAVVAAGWFGPIPVNNWRKCLLGLKLDSNNHAFRTSLHHKGRFLFLLDKASSSATVNLLVQSVDELARRNSCGFRIAMICRSATETRQAYVKTAESLYQHFDAFLLFDRPDAYTSSWARPEYSLGDVPKFLAETLEGLNTSQRLSKSIFIEQDWPSASRRLRGMLSKIDGKILVTINQSSTSAVQLNRQIIGFVSADWEDL